MKKSKIIVPALGILAFSTAAAVTGTVAWFTANRTATINNTAITAFNPEAGLQVKLGGEDGSVHTAGVSLDPAGPGSATSAAHADLRDASVDISASPAAKVYGSDLGQDGSVAGYKDVSSVEDYLAGTKNDGHNTPYYYANSYQATFTLTAAAASTDTYALIYDNGDLVKSGDSLIKEALRIGVRVSDSLFFVVSPFRTSVGNNYDRVGTVTESDFNTNKANYYILSGGDYTSAAETAWNAATVYYTLSTITSQHHVASITTTAAYADAHYMYGSEDNAASVGGTVATLSAISSNEGYMGTIKGTGHIDATVFTWFEGCDPKCANGNDDGVALTSQLSFRLVKVTNPNE